MSYHVTPEPMPGNPATRIIGDKSGPWRVVITDEGSGYVFDRNPSRRVHKENISYDEALRLSGELEHQLNESK